MDRSFVEKIEEMAEPHIITDGGYDYTDKKLTVISTPKVSTIEFNTLRGLTEVIKKEVKEFNAPMIINVRDNKTVEVHTGIEVNDRGRENPYAANAELISIRFDQFLDYETMMIMLKSRFVETPELLNVVQLLGTITNEQSAQMTDDGFTQTVVVRKGVAMKDNKVVKPIVKLKPYRTFNEVEQPESEFLLRLNDHGGVALFEADGGAWKLKARSSIAEYIRNELAELVESGAVIVTE